MAIKSKNKWLIIIWLFLFAFGLSSVFSLLSNTEHYMTSYYHTDRFQSMLGQYENYLGDFKLNQLTKEEAKASIKVTDGDISNYQRDHGGTTDVGELSEQEKAKISTQIIKQKQNQVDNYFQQQEREENQSIYAELEASFIYYFKNTKTGKIYSDMPIDTGETIDQFLEKYDVTYEKRIVNSIGQSHIFFGNDFEINRPDNSYDGIIAVPKSLPANSIVKTDYDHYHHEQLVFFIFTICGVIAFIISLFMLKKLRPFITGGLEKWQHYYERLPLDICLVLLLISVGITMPYLNFYGYGYGPLIYAIKNLIIGALFSAMTIIQIILLFRRFKEPERLKVEWKKCFTYNLLKWVGDTMLDGKTAFQVVVLLVVVLCTGFGVPIIMYQPGLAVIYLILFIFITIPTMSIFIKRVGFFNRISEYTDGLVKGEVRADLTTKGNNVLAKLARNINTLKHGVTISQEKQAKSERLKTELITNVSHDLRTPLTSIITYTELLKTPELTNEERDDYIEIIDRKSQRLKVLIEDLFEASKMASGAVELVKEKVDIVQLLQQALAENNERINESTLQFRVNKPEDHIYAVVDGQKLWRVFDNLIGNILKYSLENTRVFISANRLNSHVVITFKNITKYEISENLDELFERFKRGDTSRHTDGSGLGLAIAKSIVDLHGGSLDIEVDGDLFKVTVKLPTA